MIRDAISSLVGVNTNVLNPVFWLTIIDWRSSSCDKKWTDKDFASRSYIVDDNVVNMPASGFCSLAISSRLSPFQSVHLCLALDWSSPGRLRLSIGFHQRISYDLLKRDFPNQDLSGLLILAIAWSLLPPFQQQGHCTGWSY